MITFANKRLNDLLQQVIAHEDLKLAIYGADTMVIENILDGQMFSFTPSDADNDMVEILLGSIDAILKRGYVGRRTASKSSAGVSE